MSVDLNAELAALRQLVLNSNGDLTRYRAAHSNDCFSTIRAKAQTRHQTHATILSDRICILTSFSAILVADS